MKKRVEIQTGGPAPYTTKRRDRDGYLVQPQMKYGNWSATAELKFICKRDGTAVLHQKFRRRVKRDWGMGCWSRSMEYEWMPVPMERVK